MSTSTHQWFASNKCSSNCQTNQTTHCTLHSQQTHHYRWIRVCPDPKRYVQSPTSRNHCPTTTQKAIGHQRLSSEHHHTRFLETRLAPHLVHHLC
eukprot:CCRYP_007837-RA/>CCRYP_007837-RA protein AED:0.41 eAED:1.00 QI:0/-1/0/1/-1/0/1/0/94